MRYIITVKNGNKIVDRFSTNDYATAMDTLDTMIADYIDLYKVDFVDTKKYK
jgi:hypothetical protein